MTQANRSSAIAAAAALGWATPALAGPAEDAAVQRELTSMRAQMQQMASRIESLEGQLADVRAKPQVAQAEARPVLATSTMAPPAPAPAPTTAPAASLPIVTRWDGAPRLSTSDGWTFKPRGRMQLDVGGIDGPDGIAGQRSLGFASRVRRARLGFEGTVPGGFGYRADLEFGNGDASIADLFVTYTASPRLSFTLGHQKTFQSMEEQGVQLFNSFMERAAFNTAFENERRLGVSVTYIGSLVVVQGGVFSDDAASLNDDRNNSYSIDGRIVMMPKLAGGTLHVGASAHYRDLNDFATGLRYRTRPFLRTTDLRLIDTGLLSATGERRFGAELAYIRGRMHATVESQWVTALRPGLANPTFTGGYAEVGYLLTNDVVAYRNGTYDRIRPKRPLGKGGAGAVQLNLRYDWLDLNSGSIIGGRQQIAAASLIWIPVDQLRFILNYGHIWVEDSAIRAGIASDYSLNAMGMRMQFDF